MTATHPPTPVLLDREREIATITDALASAQVGGGALLVIAGGAGMGKTRLLASAAGIAAYEGMRCLSARGGELERELPFGVVRQLFEPALARADADERARLSEGAAALALPALDPPAEPADVPASFAILHGLYWLTAAFAAETPLLLAVDDVQWADAPSLRYLAYLAHRLEGVPALLVVALRTGDPAAEDELVTVLTQDPDARVLSPRPLGRGAVERLLEEGLGIAPEPDFTQAAHTATGGNPFLVSELLLELREREVAPVGAAAPALKELAIGGIARPVLRRLGRLPPGARALARAVAVLGEGADLATAARLADLPIGRAADVADALVAAGLLDGAAPLRFVHQLVAAAVAGSLAPGERDAIHLRAAHILVESGDRGDRVAAHLAAARPTGEAWALEMLAGAGRRAAARGAPEAAAAFLRRALDERPAPDARHALLLDLGAAEARASDPAAVEHLEQALDVAPGPALRARPALALGATLSAFGRFPEAFAVYERALEELGDGDGELRLELEAELVGVAPLDLSTRLRGLERLAALDPGPEPTSRAACKVLANLAREEMGRAGSRRRAIELAERSLTGGFLMAEEPLMAFPHAPVTLAIAGELDRAINVYDEALARSRARGAVLSVALIGGLRALATHQCGRLTEAAADARQALEAAGTYGAPLIAPWAAGFLASTLCALGDFDEAEVVLETVADVAAVPQTFSGVHVLSNRGRVRLAQGRVEEAAGDLREAGRRLEAWRVRNPGMAPWRGELALAERLLGRPDQARALAAEQLALARAWGSPWVLARSLRIAAVVEGGEAGLNLAAEAVATAAWGGARLEYLRSLVELGVLRREDGAERQAREPLREALDLATAFGARPLAERAHAELVASGAQPRRARSSGPAALTAAERRVAGLAADGLTNRAIAQALFVSEKTVETHLRNVFRKLGVAGRSQLAAALEVPS